MHISTPHRQRGLTLIESLVAIFVTALGILGILGVQMRTLADTSTTVRRAQAIRLIEDLGERMKANPNALAILGDYVVGWSATPPTPAAKDCRSVACTPAELAAFDIVAWKTSVQDVLKGGDANVFVPDGENGAAENRRQLGVMVRWPEKERYDADAAYKATISASTDSGSAATCGAGFICHLQYIPVAARCAPYRASPTSPALYFCAGS
jgi:type IV pilus assembly protein PilV